MNRPGFLIPVLALAALFLGWRVYEAWTGPVGSVPPAAAAPAASPVVLPPADAPPADLSGAVLTIVAQPVFRPDRKPYREEAAAVPRRNYQAEMARFTLLGVLLRGQDKTGIVVGKGAGGREERWEVVPGDELPGFTVKDVATDGLTLSADNTEFLLPLYAGAPKTPAGSVPPRTEMTPPRQAAPAQQPVPPIQAGGSGGRPAVGLPPSPPVAGPSMAPPSDGGRSRPYRPTYYPGRR